MGDELFRNQRQLAEDQRKIVDQVNRLSKEQARMVNNENIRNAKELLAHTYASANSYTNLIIAAGYVGIFTLWTSLIDTAPLGVVASSGALVLISLLTFISFELYKMISKALAMRQLHQKLHNPHAGTLSEVQFIEKSHALKQTKIWIWFLIPIVTTGLLAGLTLLGYFVFLFITSHLG